MNSPCPCHRPQNLIDHLIESAPPKSDPNYKCWNVEEEIDGYYVAYKPITLSCILFMFIEMKFIHCHSCVMFAMKSMSMCNDYVNYDEIII